MTEFGSKLRQLREKKGKTQQEVADQFFVSAATVSRWESGTRYPDLFTAKKLADYYGAPLDEILGEKEINEYTRRKEDMNDRIQIFLYTACAIVFLIRFAGIFLFPPVHDGSTAAAVMEVVHLLSAGVILLMLISGVILFIKKGVDPLFTGWIAIVFFLAELTGALCNFNDFGTMLVYNAPPCLCLLLIYRFFFQRKTGDSGLLEGMLIAYCFFNVILCFLQSQTYAYTSTSFVTRYRFLWSFVQPLAAACLMILFAWQVHSIHRKSQKEMRED